MSIDLRLLTCFQAVAERGGVSAASSVLYLSQPAISLQLKRLEEQLGKKLFERESHGLRLTQFGKELLVYARKLSDLSEVIERLSQTQASRPSGVLRVGTYTTISSYLISEPASIFVAKYPEVTLQYQYDTVEILLDRLKNQELESVVLSDLPERNSLNSIPLFEDELVYVIATKGKIRTADSISTSDLADIPFLSYPLRYDFCYRKVELLYGKFLAAARVPLECTSFDTLKQMLLRGTGGAFMPKYLIKNEIEQGLLKVIKIGKQRLPVRFSFVSLSDASLSITTRAFRDELFQHFGMPK